MFKMLLANGMDPNLPNWQPQTLLHDVCGGGGRGQVEKQLAFARILLDAGANISAKEEVYRSTPLEFAARNKYAGYGRVPAVSRRAIQPSRR